MMQIDTHTHTRRTRNNTYEKRHNRSGPTAATVLAAAPAAVEYEGIFLILLFRVDIFGQLKH